MLLNTFTFHAPQSLSEAAKLFAELDNIKINAGGTFLLNNLKLLKKKGIKTPEHILSLRKIEELKGIFEKDDAIIIKSMTTIGDMLDSSLLKDNCAVLKEAAQNIATTPVRNMATVGGNLTCRYTWTELPAIMIGLNAQMHFIDSEGQEEVLESEEFFKNAAKTDKIFTYVTIQKESDALVNYQRVKKTPHIDIPLLTLVVKTTIKKKQFSNTRVSVNNGVDFAKRDHVLEEFLNQSSLDENLAEEALNHLDKTIYETRSTDYKKHMFRVSIKNAINELLDQKKS